MNLPKRPPPQDAARYPILSRIMGRPNLLILDNAVEFTGHGLEDASKSAGFGVRFCPVKKPRYRAIGERAFGTIPQMIVEHMPGRTMPINYCRLTEYDAQKHACVTLGELEAAANKAIADYHTSPHDGLDSRQPALAFQKSAAKHGIDVMHDMRRFQLETMDVRSNVQVRKSGVRAFGMRYHSHRDVPVLIDNNLRYEGRRMPRADATIHTKIKFNPDNIATIHAWDRFAKKYVELECEDKAYAEGMPLWFHNDIKALATAESMAFNTPEERLIARTVRVDAIKALKPNAVAQERDTLRNLYEIPRLRNVTGNIVELGFEHSKSVHVDEFIAHDVASTTSLDDLILAPRTAPRRSSASTKRDRRDAAVGREAKDAAPAPKRRSSRSAAL